MIQTIAKRLPKGQPLKNQKTNNCSTNWKFYHHLFNLHEKFYHHLKQHLLSASSSTLKIIMPYNRDISFMNLHSMCKRATPSQIMNYKLALLAYKVFNDGYLQKEWIWSNFQQTFNNHNNKLNIYSTTNFKIGRNIPINRLNHIKNLIYISLTFPGHFQNQVEVPFPHELIHVKYRLSTKDSPNIRWGCNSRWPCVSINT